MASNAAPQAALRAALFLRALGPECAVPVMRQLGDGAIGRLLAIMSDLPAQVAGPEPVWVPSWRQRAGQDAAGAAQILLSTMSLHG